jgi:hypothetical protein
MGRTLVALTCSRRQRRCSLPVAATLGGMAAAPRRPPLLRPPAVLVPLEAGPRWPSTTCVLAGDPEGQAGPAGHLNQPAAGRHPYRDRRRRHLRPSHAVGSDVLVHLRQGGQLRLPLQDPPVDAWDNCGVIATWANKGSKPGKVVRRQALWGPHQGRQARVRGPRPGQVTLPGEFTLGTPPMSGADRPGSSAGRCALSADSARWATTLDTSRRIAPLPARMKHQ